MGVIKILCLTDFTNLWIYVYEIKTRLVKYEILLTKKTRKMIKEELTKDNLELYVKEMLSDLLNKTFKSERDYYLYNHKLTDKGNGYLPKRNIKYGTEDIPISIPRSRSGFFPSVIDKYQKSITKDYLDLLRDLILNSKNIKSLKLQAKSLGLPYKEEQIEKLIEELYEEAQQINLSRLESDYYFIYIDAKVIDIKFDDENHVTKATQFTVVAIDMDAKKHVIYCNCLKGNESLKLWKEVLNNLKNRGVTRVSMIITDDFSGLNDLVKSLFPITNHQLCLVHLLRNARKHLDHRDYDYFKKHIEQIYYNAEYEAGYSEFISLCEYLYNKGYKSWSKYLKERVDNYTATLHYPEEIQKHIKSTNTVEGINNDIEIYKRNSGGYFHSQRDLMVKMKIMIDNKYKNKWKNPLSFFKYKIYEINKIFLEQFNAHI